MPPTRPPRLAKGDTVAALSLSWPGPHAFPAVFERGVQNLQNRLGLHVKEFPTTRMDPLEAWAHPDRRAADLIAAFEDPGVNGIISTIGGDDSCRLLPLVERDIGRRHPKVFLGFSDTTTLLTHLHSGGLTTFHGPSIMAGFSQMEELSPEFEQHLRDVLFAPKSTLDYEPFREWSEGYPRWELEESVGKTLPSRPHDGWHWLQGKRSATGELFGGCLEVLEFVKGTNFWPAPSFWEGKVLFLETSEEVPTLVQVKWYLRNYGLQGAYGRCRAIMLGRARGYSTLQKQELDETVLHVVREEFGADHLPIVTNLDFGHTDPQWVLPLGGEVTVDPKERRIILEGQVVT